MNLILTSGGARTVGRAACRTLGKGRRSHQQGENRDSEKPDGDTPTDWQYRTLLPEVGVAPLRKR